MDEASLYLDTQGALTNEPIFVGTFRNACKMVWAMTAVARGYARIETPDQSYAAADLEHLRSEDGQA
jgi:hypothetical protein